MTAYEDSMNYYHREVTKKIVPFTYEGEMEWADLVDLVEERTFGEGFWVITSECIDEVTI